MLRRVGPTARACFRPFLLVPTLHLVHRGRKGVFSLVACETESVHMCSRTGSAAFTSTTHRRRNLYFSDFGGGRELCDGEDPAATAGREFAEETLGLYGGVSVDPDSVAASAMRMTATLRRGPGPAEDAARRAADDKGGVNISGKRERDDGESNATSKGWDILIGANTSGRSAAPAPASVATSCVSLPTPTGHYVMYLAEVRFIDALMFRLASEQNDGTRTVPCAEKRAFVWVSARALFAAIRLRSKPRVAVPTSSGCGDEGRVVTLRVQRPGLRRGRLLRLQPAFVASLRLAAASGAVDQLLRPSKRRKPPHQSASASAAMLRNVWQRHDPDRVAAVDQDAEPSVEGPFSGIDQGRDPTLLPRGLNHTHLLYHLVLLRAGGGLDSASPPLTQSLPVVAPA